MAVIIELHGSRTFSVNVTGGTAKFLYYIGGEPDEAAAYNMVLANSPGTWYGYTRDDINMDNRPTLDQWWPVVSYTIPVFQPGSAPPMGDGPGGAPAPGPPPPAPAPNQEMEGISISITLENQHVTRSFATVSKTGLSGAAAPETNQLIGVSDGKIEGVDIGVPVLTIQKKATLAYLSAGYLQNLLWACGKTNDADWWIFKQEEGLFVGAQGQSKGTGEFEINYEFKYQRTRQNITIRTGLVVPIKRGWHYLWTKNQPEKDTAANVMVERPFAAYVEQVYDKINFAWIGDVV